MAETDFVFDDLVDLGEPAIEDSTESEEVPESPNDDPVRESELQQTEGLVEPAAETDSTPPSQEPSPSQSDGFDYSQPLNPREQQLLARLEEVTGQTLTIDQPKADESRSEFVPQEHNFLEGLDLDDVFSSAENFNKLLLSVYNKGLETASQLALENTYRSLPATISQYVTQHLETTKMVEDFYKSNPDLENVKRTVAAVANEISAQHPEYTLQQVFDDAAVKTRQVLNIQQRKQAMPTKGSPRRSSPALPGQNSNGSRASRYEDSNLSGLAKEVHDLLVEG